MTPPFFLFRNTPKEKNQEKKVIYTYIYILMNISLLLNNNSIY
jgi:hypothetical protein